MGQASCSQDLPFGPSMLPFGPHGHFPPFHPCHNIVGMPASKNDSNPIHHGFGSKDHTCSRCRRLGCERSCRSCLGVEDKWSRPQGREFRGRWFCQDCWADWCNHCNVADIPDYVLTLHLNQPAADQTDVDASCVNLAGTEVFNGRLNMSLGILHIKNYIMEHLRDTVTESRLAKDCQVYSKSQFQEYYGEHLWLDEWNDARSIKSYNFVLLTPSGEIL
mmetsp:Transcript_122507/g.192194  ORF Transcript_122507/g.192194 Transcript_122507/m.192194 type:complete len:219 (-) Transcript_122507:24-680(-)